jgi:DNA invertase Pin-like site-specific DNA recombinase/chaperonin cofactor prefoldin
MAQSVCADKGWTLVDLPPDEGMSGFKGINKVKGTLGTFLKRVKAGEIKQGSVLIIEKMDRFSRNEIDLVIPDFLNLLQSNVEIFSCVDNTHYTLADIRKNGMLLNYAVMAMAMANDYSKSLGSRIKKATDIKLAQCRNGLKMNMGPWMPNWVDFIGNPKQPGDFKLNEKADTIKRIISEYIAGKSMFGIARGLIKDNIPSPQEGKWAQYSISKILNSPKLLGTLDVKGIVIPNYYPSVITQAQWEQVQSKLKENSQRKGGSNTTDYVANLFRNRCKCAHCGSTLQARKVVRTTHYLYTCPRKRLGACKSKSSMRVSYLEVDFFLLYLQQSPELLLSSNTTEHSEKVSRIQADILRLDKTIKDTTELIGLVPITELKSKLTSLENKRQSLKTELDKLNSNMLTSSKAPQALADIKSIVGSFFSSASASSIDSLLAQYGNTEEGFAKAISAHKETQEFDKAVKELEDKLEDNTIRKKLLGLLPSLVKSIIIDTTKKRYSIVSHNGKQSPFQEI